MPKILSIKMRRQASSSELKLEIEIKFTSFEKKENLKCWIKSALYERDAGMDKVFFWTNGSSATVHSWTQVGSDAKDDFVLFFPGKTIRPSDNGVVDGKFLYKTSIDLDDPRHRATFNRANDPIPRRSSGVPSLISDLWEELRTVVHAYNELAPSTAVSSEERQTDIKPE